MKKTYKQPDIEILKLSAVTDDFLTTSAEVDNDNGMGNSEAEITPGRIPSLH